MFQFGRFPYLHYVFMQAFRTLRTEGFPIRKSTGRRLLTANRGLSQLITSFIGSWCQGIHLMLLFAWTIVQFYSLLWVSQFSVFFLVALPPLSDKIAVSLPLFFLLGKTNFFYFNCFSLSVSFYSFIQLSMIILSRAWTLSWVHRSGWTRTIDLALIRRAL